MARRCALRAVLCALAALLLGAGPAQADTYCAGMSGSGCNVSFAPATGASVSSALTGASTHAGDDSVLIGPGTYSGQFTYTGGNGAVAIAGSGTGQTVLALPSAAGQQTGLTLDSGHTVSDLTISIPAPPHHASDPGLDIGASSATRVDIASPSGDNVTGVILHGGTF